jgi:hypothetical protein
MAAHGGTARAMGCARMRLVVFARVMRDARVA